MEIQICLHALPQGMNIGSLLSLSRGTNWLESARRLANQRQHKAAPDPADQPQLTEPEPTPVR